MSVIEIRNITKDYGNNKGVFNVSFAVEKGETLGFLGPNGAGKTTTIRQLMGFIKPDKGIVSIRGMDCFTQAEKIQRTLGYLPGEIAFPDDMTGIEFIKFIAGMRELRDLTRAKELMQLLEFDASGKIKKMSKGMKQKIAIVCAFMHDADILILDEPTSGLDPLMQNKFVELILEEQKKGKTILMSSHIFEEIERTCNKAVIIKDGHIVAVEDMSELHQNKAKNFEITFRNDQDAEAFSASWSNCSVNGSVASVATNQTDRLIKALSAFTVADINIRTQTLEELFMHFYGGDRDVK